MFTNDKKNKMSNCCFNQNSSIDVFKFSNIQCFQTITRLLSYDSMSWGINKCFPIYIYILNRSYTDWPANIDIHYRNRGKNSHVFVTMGWQLCDLFVCHQWQGMAQWKFLSPRKNLGLWKRKGVWWGRLRLRLVRSHHIFHVFSHQRMRISRIGNVFWY